MSPGPCLVCGSRNSTCKPAVETWSGRITKVEPMLKRATVIRAKERVYIDQNGKAVGPKDPNRHTLVANAGDEISLQQALEWGLVNPEPIAEEAEKTIASFSDAAAQTEESPVTSVQAADTPLENPEKSRDLKFKNAGSNARSTKRRRAPAGSTPR